MNEIDTSTLDGKIAVLTAFEEGKKVQFKSRPCATLTIPWTDAFEDCLWNWVDFDYRIKPLEFPKLPEGLEWHNPEGLTPEQYGPNHRPTVKGERTIVGTEVHRQHGWEPLDDYFADKQCPDQHGRLVSMRIPISTPFPEPPKPKAMVPLTRDDLPGIVWLRDTAGNHMLVTEFPEYGVCAGTFRSSFRNLLDAGYQWSSDRANWNPCSKESAS